jgi:uncharacterized protein (DUF885 family)
MRIFLLLLPGLLLAGCAKPSATSTQRNADAAFEQLADDYLGGYLKWRPQTGTSLGLHQYDGKVTDFSSNSLAAELARLKSFDRELADMASGNFSAQTSMDYRILRGAVQREIFGLEQLQSYTQNPMTYAGVIDVNIYIKRNFAPLPERVRSIIAILNQAPAVMTAAKINLAESLPRPYVETAIEAADGVVDFLGKDLVDALKDVKDEALMAEFKTANQRAIEELRGYSTWLKEKKLPLANQRYALGRGKYVQLLQSGEMLTQTPEQLLDIAMRELANKQKVFADTAQIIEPGKKAIEVFKEIQKDHPTAQGLIPDTAKDVEGIRKFVVDHHLVTIPSPVRVIVAETPQYLRAQSFASSDSPGVFETKATEAYYYMTPPEATSTPAQQDEWLTAFNYYTTDIVSIHECYPGHYVQFLCLNASPATQVEKIFGSYAFIEGWAHYAEQMMVDEGFGSAGPAATGGDALKAAKYRLAQTDEALLRVCRMCVSIKMHCQGMTVDEAAKFFEDNCYYEPKPARSEAMRGTFDPEYLYYTVGKLEILKLREDLRKQDGADFSLLKFHDEMLRHGMPPVRLLREVLLKDKSKWNDVF